MGTVRWTYNQALEAVKQGTPRTLKDLRALCVKEDAAMVQARPWLTRVPFDVRDEGLRDLLKAYRSSMAKGGHFQVKPRRRKDSCQTMVVHKKHWKTKRGVYTWIRDIASSEPLPEELAYDSRILVDRLGRFFFCLPMALQVQEQNKAPSYTEEEIDAGAGVVALDPGVRTFQTCYTADGEVHHWSPGDISKIHRLCWRYDQLQSKRAQLVAQIPGNKADKDRRHRKIRRMRKAGLRLQAKIRGLVQEVHCKLVLWLCRHYRLILLPDFETSEMVRKTSTTGAKRRINRRSARAMLTWSHYKFKQRLLHKAREFPWVQVMLVNEAYTSKTCGACGHIHDALGGSKVFRCPQCGLTVDRDVNGARNIILRTLAQYCPSSTT